MMRAKAFESIVKACLASLLLSLAGAAGWAAEDTSFAIENSYACLAGGCHETNARLLEEHASALMTHAMVKCNACHGTHTAAQLGQPKPNLTGYYPGIGATGYEVGRDRCVACHSARLIEAGHPRNPRDCTGCHAPHAFKR